jgi:hypothetical protein
MTGPFVDASSLVMHRDGAVQMEPLTCTMRMDCDSRNDHHRRMIARFVWSLDRAIRSLKQFYDECPYTRLSLSDGLSFVPHEDTMAADKPNHAIVCLYTYLRSYVKLGSEGVTIPFEYVHEMFRDRLLFQAVESDSRKQILIKFTCRYAAVMHKLLAEKQLAP